MKPSRLALLLLLLLACLPPLAVLLYGFSERWDRSLLPEGATLHWLLELLGDARSQAAVINTLALSLASALLALLLGTPASLLARLAAPRLLALLDALALLPYAIPPVVIAIGALELFVGRWGAWLDVRWVYIGVVTPLLFPLVHKAIGAAFEQLDAPALLEAGRTLGASDGRTLRLVLLPLLLPTLISALLLCWVTAAMEFAIANLLLGGTVELLQPLMNSMRNVNGHQSAALIVLSFAVVALLGGALQGVMGWKSKKPASR
ncbi:ABC transporter permease subunit [Paucibacter sp. APW11]|uniref:ABC transporter permease subunit n=1 Tax=Roseateles aquae TaxID=3077235 RepID=A0ABU3PGM4_9BURK|nr:ABC transporter permease subunit [Paucibacter sp. APW11]MDT9001141.1 ABC transporter permease subunit [Paucibacter sp. APW11]